MVRGDATRRSTTPPASATTGRCGFPRGWPGPTRSTCTSARPPPTPPRSTASAWPSRCPCSCSCPPPANAETRVFGPFAPFSDARWPLEVRLRRSCRPPNGRGILDDGDQVRLESLADGRVVTRTTENLAYELPRSILWQYLRSGDQRLFWEAEAAVRHLMDVDTVHHRSEHPEWVGGPCLQWSQNHHWTTTEETDLSGPRTSHTWLGSLLDYHFLTGCQRARQVAGMCADYCRRAAPYEWKEELTGELAEAAASGEPVHWPFSTRSVGWALTGMGTWYDAFPEERFLPAMEALVDLLEVWQDEHGRWRDRIGTHNLGETPFMVSGVLQGLQLYHAATGEGRARGMLLAGARFLARHGRTPEGLFYYKEAPISADPHASTAMLLGPLAWAHEQTGEAELLDAGYRLFRWLVDEGAVSTYMLKDLIAFMPLLERAGLLSAYEPPRRPCPDPGEGALRIEGDPQWMRIPGCGRSWSALCARISAASSTPRPTSPRAGRWTRERRLAPASSPGAPGVLAGLRAALLVFRAARPEAGGRGRLGRWRGPRPGRHRASPARLRRLDSRWRAHRPQPAAATVGDRLPDQELRRRRGGDPRQDHGYPQDHPGPAAPAEGGRAQRRRLQPSLRAARRRADKGRTTPERPAGSSRRCAGREGRSRPGDGAGCRSCAKPRRRKR